jgi:hypothetical protein
LKTVLDEAKDLVFGDRQRSYSHPKRDYAKTAKMWTGVLLEKLKPGEEITPMDAVLMMVCLKISRETYRHKHDNLVDMAGYTVCAERIAEDK